MKKWIFINYRRDNDAGVAGRIYDHLINKFPNEHIFIDVNAIEPGLDFLDTIRQSIAKSKVFLSIIGKSWIECKDKSGLRKIDNTEDVVRLEIEAALYQEKIVVPILIDTAEMPIPSHLPSSLIPLSRRNAIRIRHERFSSDIEVLAQALAKLIEDTRFGASQIYKDDSVDVMQLKKNVNQQESRLPQQIATVASTKSVASTQEKVSWERAKDSLSTFNVSPSWVPFRSNSNPNYRKRPKEKP